MRTKRLQILTSFALTFLLVATYVGPVYAHANLIRSDPAANSILSTSPQQVSLYFTEQLEPRLSGAEVYDTNSKEVDTGYAVSPTDGTILIITLPTLPSGVYTVSWHAISSVDGHHTSGSFSFGVGNVTIPVHNTPTQTYAFPSALEILERWLNLLADALFLGGSIFVLSIWNLTLPNNDQKRSNGYDWKVSNRIAKLVSLSAVVAVGATMLLLVVESLAATPSSSISGIFALAATILSSTRLGEYWTFRFTVALICLGASIILLRRNKNSNIYWSLILILGLILSLSTSITSHDAATTSYDPRISLLADWTHLVATSGWVGGLAYLTVAITSLDSHVKQRAKILIELLKRFSSMAVIFVGAIGVTGLYNLVLEVGSFSLLFTTAYGEIILLKIAFFAPMIAFGALNQFVIFDKLVYSQSRSRLRRQERARWYDQFRLSVRTELSLGILLLLVVGLLTASAPVAQAPTPASQNPDPFVARGFSMEGVNVTLKVFPFQAGINHFEIDFTDQQGNPISNIRSVSLKLQYLDKNIGVSFANATASPSPGQYALDGSYLSFSGDWRVEVWAQRSEGFDVVAPFQLNVPAISDRFSELPLSSDSNPYGIAVDHSGTVWIAESGSGNLASYQPSTSKFNEFHLPETGSRPFYITIDNNSNVWMTETQYNQIIMFNPSNDLFKQYSVPTPGAVPGGITVDRNGNVWFTEELTDKLGRLNPPTGEITEFQIPTPDAIPIQITTAPQGALWFTESKAGKIGRLNPEDGNITEFHPPNRTLLGPTGIAVTSDGSVWFSEHAGNRITQFNLTSQTFESSTIPTPNAFPFGIAYHANRIWFVEHIANAIGTLDVDTATFSSFPIPNNSSDAQLLAVDESGNVWFTLPATNTLGALTSTTSDLQLTSNANDSTFTQFAIIAALIICTSSALAFVIGRRRMRRKMGRRTARISKRL